MTFLTVYFSSVISSPLARHSISSSLCSQNTLGQKQAIHQGIDPSCPPSSYFPY